MTINEATAPAYPAHAAILARIDRTAATIRGCLDEASPGSAYADESGSIREHAEDISVYLALWSMRDGDEGTPDQRQSANDAMDAIGALERQLHAVRSRLTGEMRRFDDETGRRVDALLAAHRQGVSR
jgi:hypothetical protein